MCERTQESSGQFGHVTPFTIGFNSQFSKPLPRPVPAGNREMPLDVRASGGVRLVLYFAHFAQSSNSSCNE